MTPIDQRGKLEEGFSSTMYSKMSGCLSIGMVSMSKRWQGNKQQSFCGK